MKSKIITCFFFACSILSDQAQAASFVVSPGQSLQAAIDIAAAGDNITVQSGNYNENISISKGVDIRGAGGAVVVTGTLAVNNPDLPVYVSDIVFGKSGASGITLSGTGSLKNVRMDRCSLLGGGNLSASGVICYFYKFNFDSSVAFSNSEWTFQRCKVQGGLASTDSSAKCIASVVNGTFVHSGNSAKQATIFQSDLKGAASVTLPSGQEGWICYSYLRSLDLVGGSCQITGNHVSGYSNTYFMRLGIGSYAEIRNNHFFGDGAGLYPSYWVVRQDGETATLSNFTSSSDGQGTLIPPPGYTSINYNNANYTGSTNSPSWLTAHRQGNYVDGAWNSGINDLPQNLSGGTVANPWFWMTGGTTLTTAKHALLAQGQTGSGAVAIEVLNGAGSIRVFNNTAIDVRQFVKVSGSPAGIEIRGNIHRGLANDADRLNALGYEHWLLRSLREQGVSETSISGGLYQYVSGGTAGAAIIANESVRSAFAGTIVSDNNFEFAVIGGQAANNVNVDPALGRGPNGEICWLGSVSPARDNGPVDALYNDLDGSRNDQGAYGGHSYDSTGMTTLKPVVLSGSVAPVYVKRGGAVTIKARAAVSAAP